MNQALIEAAIAAGKEILSVYKSSDFGVEFKSDSSPLTLADKKSHDVLMGYLATTEYPVLSEEGKEMSFAERRSWKTFWLVDPLDGTKEFIKKNGDFTVNVALIENGEPVEGVVYVPMTDTLYYAKKGAGAYIYNNASVLDDYSDGERIRASRPVDKNAVIVASRSHMSQETQDYIDQITAKGYDVSISSRGSSLKLCMVAEGKAHAYPRFGPTMEWDTAAAHAICLEAGAIVMDMKTKKQLVYNKENLRNNFFLVFPKEWSDL